MKKLLSLLLVLVIASFSLTSCSFIEGVGDKVGGWFDGLFGKTPVEETPIEEAINSLNEMYAAGNGTSTANDFELVAQLTLEGTTFTITWTSSSEAIGLTLNDGLWTVSIPEVDAVLEYTLTATVTTAGGQTANVTYNRVVPYSFGMIANPTVDTAYKFALLHGGNGKKVVYFDGNNYNNYAWYLSYTEDILQAVDVYLEAVEGVEGGVRLYFMKDGEKTYIKAGPRDGDLKKGTLEMTTTTPDTYYTYSTQYNTLLYTHSSGDQYFLGSSGTFKSISCAHIDELGDTTYLARLYGAGGVKEELPEQKLPTIPENYTSEDVVDALYQLKSGQQMEGPYTITGVVTEITAAFDPQYSNVSVKIVVGDLTDKPVILYRIKGIGADTVKVGDTITVIAGITNYNGTYETMSGGAIHELIPGEGAPEQPETPTYTAPVAGSAYKLALVQTTLGKTLYFAGTLDASKGTYLATTEDAAAATVIYFETTTGGYHIYFMNGETKTYINNDPYLKSGNNGNQYAACHFTLGTTPNCVWKYDTTLGILEVDVTIEGKSDTFFAGTYSNYNTISLSGAYYKDQIPSGTQFPARIELVEGEVTPPAGGEVTPPAGGEGEVTPPAGPTVPENIVTSAPAAGTYNIGVVYENAYTYLTGANTDKNFRYVIDTLDKAGVFTLEAVEGGYNVKLGNKYLVIKEVVSDTKTFVNALLVDAAEGVWVWDADLKTLAVTLNNEKYVLMNTGYNNVTAEKVSKGGTIAQLFTVTVSEGGNEGGNVNPGTPTETTLPENLSFTIENKQDGDAYMAEHYADWTITGTLGGTYQNYLGFGRKVSDKGINSTTSSSIKSSAISTTTAFTVTAVIKGNGSNGVMTSTLTFTLVDAEGNVIATGYAEGADTAAITPVDAKDTTYNISFTFVEGKSWSDVANLVVTFAKTTGNIGLKSLDFVQ